MGKIGHGTTDLCYISCDMFQHRKGGNKTHGRVHLMDQVGRSFSRMRVYTESVDRVPTARRPDLQSIAVTWWPSGSVREE